MQLYKLLETVNPKNSLEILNSQSLSMARMRKEKGEGYVKALLTLLIIDTVDFLNLGKTMSNNQVMQTVNLILEDYWHYKADHFVMCFNKAKKGYFGKNYDRIDGQIIFGWLEQFDLEFSTDVEAERRNESKRHMKELSEPVNEEVLTKMPDWFADSIRKMNQPKPLEPKPSEMTEEQKYFNGIIKEFNELHEQQGAEPCKKFVNYNGKMLDVNEYIEARIN